MTREAEGPGRLREGAYRALLLWYPKSFRRRYGSELLDAFRDMWRAEARGGLLGGASFWARVVTDAVTGGLATRLGRTRAPAGPYGARERVGLPGWLSGLGSDARQAGRVVRRSPGFAAIVVVMLAVGIGASTSVFMVLHAVLIRPLPYDAPERLVRLYMTEEDEPGSHEFVTGTHYLAYRDQVSSLSALAPTYTYAETGADVVVGGRPERVRTLSVGADYFEVLATRPQFGRGFRRDEEVPGSMVAVLSADLAGRLFGDASAADIPGRSVTLSGVPFTVAGVMPESFEDPLVGAVDVWLPQDMEVTEEKNQPYNFYLSVLGRLAPGVPLGRAQAEVDAVAARLREEYPGAAPDAGAVLVPLHEDRVGRARTLLWVLFGAVGVVLLVVCVNLANLFLVRSLERRRELAVRAALGSGGLRLGRQLVLESLGLAAVGGALGVALAWLAVRALPALASDAVPRLGEVRLDLLVLAYAVAVTLAVGVLFGLVPALRFGRPDLAGELRDRSGGGGAGGGGGKRTARARGALVVAQVALSLVLLAGSGLLVASFERLREVDLGFRPEGAVTFQVHLPDVRYDAAARARFHDRLTDRLAELPGVAAAGAINRLPATGRYYSWGTGAGSGPLAGREDGFIGGNQRAVEGDVLEALGIELVRGRSFDDRDDATAPRRYVISRMTADRLFPGVDPLGQSVIAGGREGEVIGVAEDAVSAVEGQILPVVYHHHPQFADDRNWALTYVLRTTSDPLALVPAARRAVAELDPELVLFRPEPLDAVVGQGRAQRSFALGLMLSFAAVALALAALGLYAVLAYTVAQRRTEIGVRVAIGATAGRIRRSVLGQAVALAAVGAAIGLAASLALSRWLESLVFGVGVRDPAVLAAVTALVLAVAGLAGLIPAVRATRVDPRVVLEEG